MTAMIADVPLGVSFSVALPLVLLALLSLKLLQRWRLPQGSAEKAVSGSREAQRRLPGPWRLPLIGSYLWIRLPFRRWLPEAVARYGDVFAFRLSGYTWVLLNTTERIQEALVQNADSMSGRQRLLWSESLLKGSGIVLGDGEVWRKHRNMALGVLKDFGFNRASMEDTVMSEIQKELNELPGQCHTVDSDLLANIAANIICRIVFGSRATDEAEFGRNLRAVQTVVQADVYTGFATAVLLPLLRRWRCLLWRLKRLRDAKAAIEQLLSSAEARIREEASANRNNNAYQACTFVEAAVRLIGENALGADRDTFSEGRLAVTLFDLTIAGTDSTASTLKWIFLRLAGNPEHQDRLASDIERVTGARSVVYSDQTRLPQLRAFIEETLRLHPAVPTAIVHRAERPATLSGGFRIPEGAWVVPNLRAAHRDPRHFSDPLAFRPDRFLDADGAFRPSPQMMPFSVGPRACLGEQLARMEIFLATAAFLQQFRLRVCDCGHDAGVDVAERLLTQSTDGLISCPPPFRLCLIRRDGT